MAEKRRPWSKWYWGDWRKDARLRRCSYAARGLWGDMLSLMGGECDRFGFLMMEGQPLDASDLVGLLGGTEREVRKLLAELEGKKVFSRAGDEDLPEDVAELIGDGIPPQTIISRRMIRDKAKEDRDKANGSSGGNPNLKPNTIDTLSGGLTPSPGGRLNSRPREKPEAICQNQKPETNPYRGSAAAQRIVERFLALRRELWPREQDTRLVLTTLETQADQYLADGVTEALCTQVIEHVIRGNARSGKSAPSSLRFCRMTMQDAIASAKSSAASSTSSSLRDSEYDRSRAYVQLWLQNGDWPTHRGPKPGERGCTIDPRVLTEFEAQIRERTAA